MNFQRMKETSKSVLEQKISSAAAKIRSSQRNGREMRKEMNLHSKIKQNNRNGDDDHFNDPDDAPFLTNEYVFKSNQNLKNNLDERLKPKIDGEENNRHSEDDKSDSLETYYSILWNDVGTKTESSAVEDKCCESFWKQKCQVNQMFLLMASSVLLTYTIIFFQVRTYM